MNERDELLHRITEANPVPNDAELPRDLVDGRPPLGLLLNRGAGPSPVARPQRSAHAGRRWRGPLVAAGTAVAILGVVGASLVLLRAGRGGVADPSIVSAATTIESTATTVTSPPTTFVASLESWDPILATTTAAVAPPAAECPADSNPEVPGSVDQPRPEPGWIGNLAAAFDQHTGRVVYVDVTGETWLFDVCTNTWHRAEPDGAPVPVYQLYDARGQPSGVIGNLVYDVDSDVTVMISPDHVSIYDANANTWSQRDIEDQGVQPLGAVYDPVSGLVITSTLQGGDVWGLWAYDVDTNEWTLLGSVSIDRDTPCCTQIDFLGYSNDLDRLILSTNFGETNATLLVDPRSGEMVVKPATDVPIIDLGWPSHVYGTGDGTVHVYMQEKRSICWFDAETGTWPCLTGPPDTPEQYAAFSAIVGDPINDRILLINGVFGDWWMEATDDVWAVDSDSGGWNQVIAPSQQ